MSHTVVRGKPTAAQLHLDEILNAIILERTTADVGKQNVTSAVRRPESVLLSEIVFHCMKTRRSATLMTNAHTGESFTHEQILRKAVSLARALLAAGAGDKNVIFLMRNHEHMVALYYAAIFAGVVPLMMEPSSSPYEVKYFMDLVDPFLVFCDEERYGDVVGAVNVAKDKVIIVNNAECMKQFVDGHSDDFETYLLPQQTPETTIMMLPTSGSTGLPKASHINHQGLVAQAPSLWTHHTQFPTPTRLIMLLSTPQWMTHSIVMTSSLVFQVPLLVTPLKSDPQHILHIIDKYQPSWTLFIPSFAPILAAAAAPGQLASLETVIITGSALPPHLMAIVEEKVTKPSLLITGYGMTETQAFVTLQSATTPKLAVGKVFNFYDYKIVDDNEQQLGTNETGELYLKSKYSIFKGYHKNEEEYKNCVTSDGWLKTGDFFYRDENEEIFYVTRRKFMIKYFNHQIAPEEVEQLIGTVSGVHESVVCGTERGAAAAVVVRPGHAVSREQIHAAVAQLSEYKRLRGGIAFVASLPRTHSGKLQRLECTDLLNDLVRKKLCF